MQAEAEMGVVRPEAREGQGWLAGSSWELGEAARILPEGL